MNDIIYDYLVIGLGPAGIGFVNTIGDNCEKKIAVIDAGLTLSKERNCGILTGGFCNCKNPENCNMIHGVGGASLLGGHKISCFPAGTFLNDILVKQEQNMQYYSSLLERLAKIIDLIPPMDVVQEDASRFYGRYGYNFKYYDSYLCSFHNLKQGYNILLKNLKNTSFFTQTRALDCFKEGDFFITKVQHKKSIFTIKSRNIIFAVGRAGDMFLRNINEKLFLKGEKNHLEVGVRIEFPSEIFEDIDKFHNDLKLLRNNIRTFCISKHGKLAPYYSNGMYYVDGFIDINNPTKFTNLALMLRLDSNRQNDVLEYITNKSKSIGKPILQPYESVIGKLSNNPYKVKSSIKFLEQGDVLDIFPKDISAQLKDGIVHFVESFIKKEDWGRINVISPSVEYFWPSFPINEDFLVSNNIYMIGDCCGKYRGILQAFVSGSILGNKLLK